MFFAYLFTFFLLLIHQMLLFSITIFIYFPFFNNKLLSLKIITH